MTETSVEDPHFDVDLKRIAGDTVGGTDWTRRNFYFTLPFFIFHIEISVTYIYIQYTSRTFHSHTCYLKHHIQLDTFMFGPFIGSDPGWELIRNKRMFHPVGSSNETLHWIWICFWKKHKKTSPLLFSIQCRKLTKAANAATTGETRNSEVVDVECP